MISCVGNRWLDRQLNQVKRKQRREQLKNNRERSVKQFIKKYPKWQNKKGIFITANDANCNGEEQTFSEDGNGYHWITLGIHFIKKNPAGPVTRSAGKTF